jgi:TIR domain
MGASSTFVSHNHTDIGFCRPFVDGLRAAGLDVWYDETNLLAGAIREKIESTLAACEHFVVVLSPAAVASKWVNAEVDAALDLERSGRLRTFLPVVAAACDMPLLLRGYKCVSGPGYTALPVDEAVRQTVTALTAPGTSPLPATGTSALPSSSESPSLPATAETPAAWQNEGIIVTGGTLNAGAVAVGRDAHAQAHLVRADQALSEKGRQEIRMRLDALVSVVTTHRTTGADNDEAAQLLEAMSQELTRGQPSRVALNALLQGLTATVPLEAAAGVEALRRALDAQFS